RGAPGPRVRLREGRLRRRAAPGIRGRGLLRRGHSDRDRRTIVSDRDGGIDRAGAVPQAAARDGAVKRSTLYAVAAVLAVAALFFVMTTARAKRSEEHTSELQSR